MAQPRHRKNVRPQSPRLSALAAPVGAVTLVATGALAMAWSSAATAPAAPPGAVSAVGGATPGSAAGAPAADGSGWESAGRTLGVSRNSFRAVLPSTTLAPRPRKARDAGTGQPQPRRTARSERTEPPRPAGRSSAAHRDGGISDAPCASGTEVEYGLTPDAVRVHRAVCARYPQITSYGGLRSDGTHAEGRALDIMVPSSLGTELAEWVRANAGPLGVSEVIWSQRIWTVQRSSEGWRAMEDRGSPTANHYDHVHVTVYGNAGG